MGRRAAAFLIAVALALCSYGANAQDHPLTRIPGPGELTSGFYFPEYANKKFPAGQEITVLVGLHNDGSSTYNITRIAGSLNSPTDFNMHIQNFTVQDVGIPVKGGDEMSLEYRFTPDYRLEPRQFVVALTVFYEDAKEGKFATTFFNQTIDIVEVKKLVDFELLFLFVMLGGIALGVGYLIYQSVSPYFVSIGVMKKSKRTNTRRAAPSEATKAADDDDWVKGTNYDSLIKNKASKATQRKK